MKRYRVDFGYGRYYFEERDDGDWMRYADHQVELERLRAALRAIREWHCGIPTDCPLMADAHHIADEALGSPLPQSAEHR